MLWKEFTLQIQFCHVILERKTDVSLPEFQKLLPKILREIPPNIWHSFLHNTAKLHMNQEKKNRLYKERVNAYNR